MNICKFCGLPVVTERGHRQREYCNDAHRQAYWRQQHQDDQNTALLAEMEELRAKVHDQAQEIEQLEHVIADLKSQLEIEYRFFLDTQSRGFKSWLKKQKSTPFIQKMVTERLFPPQSSRARYDEILRFQMKCSNEEMKTFEALWKAMLLQA